jgi:hypothetical protein
MREDRMVTILVLLAGGGRGDRSQFQHRGQEGSILMTHFPSMAFGTVECPYPPPLPPQQENMQASFQEGPVQYSILYDTVIPECVSAKGS